MALVSKNIPNLINGVSQQPAALRLESQGEVQENGFSDVVDGLKKRPPTKFLKQLKCLSGSASNITTNLNARSDYVDLSGVETAFFHTYKRSDDEQYHVIITSQKKIHVYDIEGNLRYQSGHGSWLANGNAIANSNNTDNTAASAYFTNATGAPAWKPSDITTTSVADATFIVNKAKAVQMDSNKIIPANNVNQALVYLKSVNYGRDYKCTVTSKTEDEQFTATKSSIEQITIQGSGTDAGTTNDNELKVSKIMSDTGSLRSAVATALGASNEWSYSGGAVAYDADYTVLLVIGGLGNTLTTTAVSAGEFTVRVGGAYIPYDSTGTNGWKRHNNSTIHLPNSVIIQQGGQTGVLTRGAVLVKRTSDSSAGYLTPVTPNFEPYFIINTLDSGTIKDFDIQVTDDDGGVNLKAFKGNAKSFTDLPNQCENGFRLGVVGDNQKKEDDFHVVFTGEAGSGYWKETVGYNLVNYYDKATMPHTLRQNGDLSFTFEQGEWQERKAGDDNTNPAPSFVSGDQPSYISDIFFHRNRLGILSGENVIFSEAGNEFNFFRTTVRSLLDSDPIDVAVSQNEVSELKAAVPIQDNLLLFSNLNQFTLSASQLLTPAEVTVDQSTKYECDLTTSPVGAGNSVFFATKSGSYAGVREFFTRDDTEIKDAVDITSHVPEYLTGNIREFAASSNEDMLVALTSSNKKECYVYKWYNSTTERLQSSWSKWTFSKSIASVAFNNADLYFTFTDGSYEVMSLTGSSSAITVTETPTSSANLIYITDSFGGTDYDTINYINPSNREEWAGWASTASASYRIQAPYGAVLTFNARCPFGGSTDITFTLENAPYPYANPMVDLTPVTISGSTYSSYTVVIDPEPADNVYTNIIMRSSASNVRFGINSLKITANEGLVRGAEQDVLLDHRKYILGAQSAAALTTWGIDEYTQFVNHKGVVVGQGNSTEERQKVSDYLNGQHNEILDHNGDGTLTNAAVNNYVYVGQPYTFKYQMSEQIFKPAQGDATKMARLQLRKVSFNFNDTGYFEVDVTSTGRDANKTTFTGRTLGQIDNLLGYSAVVQDGTQEIGIQSQASQTDITITNDTHLPCVFQSAEWEGFVTLRNQRL